MTAAFDKHFVTREDIIQSAINSVENEYARQSYQVKFDAEKDAVYGMFSRWGGTGSSSFARLMKGSERVEVDPERLKRWIAIAKVLLPLILALL